jgi:hypothetical protein
MTTLARVCELIKEQRDRRLAGFLGACSPWQSIRKRRMEMQMRQEGHRKCTRTLGNALIDTMVHNKKRFWLNFDMFRRGEEKKLDGADPGAC